MTSVDSGVETGNDSNDSLVAQHENIPAGQASVSTTFVSTAGNKMEGEENQSDSFPFNIETFASSRLNLKNYFSSKNNISLTNLPGTSGPLTFHPSETVFMSTAENKMEDKKNQSDSFPLNLEFEFPHLKHYIASTNNISLTNRPGTSSPLAIQSSESVIMSTAGNNVHDEEKQSDLISTNHGAITSIHPHFKYIASTNNISLSNRPGTSSSLAIQTSQALQPFAASKMLIIPTPKCPDQILSTVEFIKTIRRSGLPFSIESNSRQANCFKPKMRLFRARPHCIKWKEFQGTLNERKMRMATATNNLEVVRRLLESGISPNNIDSELRTPLHLASCRGYTEMVQLLLEHGADPNQRDCIGNTPLHLAAVTNKISVVTLLLKAGTDVLSSDRHGHNPLQIAQTKLKILQSCKGADMIRIKEEVHNIVDMLLAYLEKQKNAQEQVENLSNFCSRLSLSNTSNQIQDDVRDLLANLNSLSLTS